MIVAEGFPTDSLLRRIGLPSDALGDADFDISMQHFVNARSLLLKFIWPYVTVNREARGSSADFELICQCLVSSVTLGEAIQRLSSIKRMVHGIMGYAALAKDGEDARFVLEMPQIVPRWRAYYTLEMLTMYERLFEWAINERMSCSYTLERHGAFNVGELAKLFFISEISAGDKGGLSFSASHLNKKIVRPVEEWRSFLIDLTHDAIARECCNDQLDVRIRAIFRQSLTSGNGDLAAADVARQVGLSEATLARRLAKRQLTLRLLKEQVKSGLALEYLATRMSPTQVGMQLGFSCGRAFVRAFTRWHGKSPAHWIRKHR
jgi:AraC-like DNA-binding protein